jgi:hypothetical protein
MASLIRAEPQEGGMPRFRFTTGDDGRETGEKVVDLPNLSAAKTQAVEEGSRPSAIVGGSLWADGHLQIDVTHESALSLVALMINGLQSSVSG